MGRWSDDSLEALRNDYLELLETFRPEVVQIEREKPPAGCMCVLVVTVHAPTWYLTQTTDIIPKKAAGLVFEIAVQNGYPQTKPKVRYREAIVRGPGGRMRTVKGHLASVNVFRNGEQCTDHWGANSSLRTLAEKTIRDIIHDPAVTRYGSMANSALKRWQEKHTANGDFPTLDPFAVLRTAPETGEEPVLPDRETGYGEAGPAEGVKSEGTHAGAAGGKTKGGPPPLPPRPGR